MSNYLNSIGVSRKVTQNNKVTNNVSNFNNVSQLNNVSQVAILSQLSNGVNPFLTIYCRAPGCTSCKAPGQKHCCRVCGSVDSDHRTRNCPMLRTIRVYCRAVGCTTCTRPGQTHYCKNCGDTNSNHLTQDCFGGSYNSGVKKTAVMINGVLVYL